MSCHVMDTISGLLEPEIVPFDPPTPKIPAITKLEVDRMTHCGDKAIRNSTLSRGVHLTPPFWG